MTKPQMPNSPLNVLEDVLVLVLVAAVFLTVALPPTPSPAQTIEGLSAPTPARPPAADDANVEDDLTRKRQDRHRRDRSLAPPAESPSDRRDRRLREEAVEPRPLRLILEVSAAVTAADTHGRKAGYTSDPTSHFNLFWRTSPSAAARGFDLWTGLRVAPFAGTGYYRKRPGSYGLTYFGPMIGLGRIERPPGDLGRTAAGDAADVPSVSGWLVTAGIAGVSRSGRSERSDQKASDNDFVSKGFTFDAPGLWVELRHIRVVYGAIGLAPLAGAQLGTQRNFYYAGVGVSGLY